jgi:hypothetical protein
MQGQQGHENLLSRPKLIGFNLFKPISISNFEKNYLDKILVEQRKIQVLF